MSLLRRAVPAAVATAAVVALLANVRSRPPDLSAKPVVSDVPEPRRVSARPATVAGRVRTGTGQIITTPFSVIQVRVTFTGKQLTRVETVELSGNGPRTQAINAHAEPILREEALEAGSAKIDVVSGATYTSESYRDSLQSAIDAARG
ncbi:MAG TPA: FMN-binding protein [Solirubrobacteraceae bacterium]|nr:FMN-binding protein [Solirubrobacteraceae bacterium]